MPALTRLLLIPAALSLWSSVAIAKDIPGLPKELLGNYAATQDECRFSEGDIDLLEKNGQAYYGFCPVCLSPIVSHRKIKNGYILNINWASLSGPDKRKFYMIKRGGNEFTAYFYGNPPLPLFRCDPSKKEDPSNAPGAWPNPNPAGTAR